VEEERDVYPNLDLLKTPN